MSIYLAYDGSVNGDWISRYAIRFAANHPERKLTVLYVEDVSIRAPALDEKLANIEAAAASAGIEVEPQIIPMRQGVAGGLLDRMPAGRDHVLVCGARARGGRQGILGGTISKRLLTRHRCTVVAIRVVQPGHLGVARRVLLPLSGSAMGVAPALPVLNLLAPDVRRLRLLRVMELGRFHYRRLDSAEAGRLQREGRAFLQAHAGAIAAETPIERATIDIGARVSDDWVNEVIIDTGQQHADLVCIEAPKESLSDRLLFGDPLERVLRDAPCDVAVYRGPLPGDSLP